eukprot:524654-Pleurochrysis_carterae.AAC.3
MITKHTVALAVLVGLAMRVQLLTLRHYDYQRDSTSHVMPPSWFVRRWERRLHACALRPGPWLHYAFTVKATHG